MGCPFEKVYQPGFHFAVAGLSTVMGWTIQHAYHFLTAFNYCAAAVTLFWMCYAVSKDRMQALTASLLFSLISPTCFLAPLIRARHARAPNKSPTAGRGLPPGNRVRKCIPHSDLTHYR